MDTTLEKQQAALDIVLSTGRLKQCEVHPHSLLAGDLDATAACYGLAMERFKSGELSQFEEPEDLVQHIRGIIDGFGETTCFECAPVSQELRTYVRSATANKLKQMAQQVGVEEGQIIDCLVEAWPTQQDSWDQLVRVLSYRLGTDSLEDILES